MADIEITKMSSKGQIVIPRGMRKSFRDGEKFVVIKAGKQLILKSTDDFDKNIEEDLEFARRTEEAYKKHERGEYISIESEEFLKKLKKW